MTAGIPQRRRDRHQLQQIIAGLSEGIILIDPDQSIAWANEAALAIHGVTKLEELGSTVSDYRRTFELRYRNRHPLAAGQYPIERVVAGEAFQDVVVTVVRAGTSEPQWVHEIRSLVLTDGDGLPDCLVLIIHDLTEQVSAEDRFERAFAANPAPAVICRLSDLRYVKVNDGFLELSGYSKEELLGRSVYEIDVLEQAEKRDLAIERLSEGHTIPQMEAVLRLADGGDKLVIVAGQPIDMGDEPCMLFTFADLEPRRKAETALRHSEERLSQVFRLAPVAQLATTIDEFRILEVNHAFVALTGCPAEQLVGKLLRECDVWEEATAWAALARELKASNSIRDIELPVRTRDGAHIDCLLSAHVVTIREQDCVLWVLQDITERKRTESEVVAAITAVMQDTSWFSQTVLEKLATLRTPHLASAAGVNLSDLTGRELEVLGWMCQGLDDSAIAKQLKLSRNTVRNHVATIYGKIGVHRRAAAVIWARERGITGTGSVKPRASRPRW